MKEDPNGRDRRRAAEKGRCEDEVLVREHQKKGEPNLVTLPPVKRTPLPACDMRRLERTRQQLEEAEILMATSNGGTPRSEQDSEILVLRDPKIGVERRNGKRRIYVLNLRSNGGVPAKKNGHVDKYKVSGGPAQFSRY